MHCELTRDFQVWSCINKYKQTCVRGGRIDFNLTLKLFKIRDDLRHESEIFGKLFSVL